MQITYQPPADRGVTTLMYVGDDEAVEKAVAPPRLAGFELSTRNLMLLAGIGAIAYIAMRKPSSRERSASRVRRVIRRRR